MDSQNKKHSPLRLLSSFHMNEDGTAMTEFVVVLPIFILMFVGMNELYKTNRQGLRAKITAAKSTWQASMDVANASQFGAFEHKLNFIAAAQEFNRTTGSGLPYAYSLMRTTGLLSSATRGEADRATNVLGLAGAQRPSGNYPRVSSPTFAKYITDDSSTNSVSVWGPLNVYQASAVLSNLGPNQPHAAGIRYGLVKGEFSGSHENPYGTIEMGDEYSMLVPPRPVEGIVGEHITIGFSRLSARKDRCLKNVLKIDYSFSYMRNCR